MPLLLLQLLASLKKIPSKDLLYCAIIIAAGSGFWWYTVHERHVGAAKNMAAVQAASKKADTVAQKKIAQLTAQHTEDVSNIEDHYETLIKSADAQHDSDLERLHNAARGSTTDSHVESSSGSQSAADLWRQRFVSVGDVSEQLATALRKDDAALKACYAERDSLTGKP